MGIYDKYIFLLNQIFEIEKKLSKYKDKYNIKRNLESMKLYISDENFCEYGGFEYYNPIGEKYSEQRCDCEASITGNSDENLKIIEVIKPIIYMKKTKQKIQIQKGIVIVKGESDGNN